MLLLDEVESVLFLWRTHYITRSRPRHQSANDGFRRSSAGVSLWYNSASEHMKILHRIACVLVLVAMLSAVPLEAQTEVARLARVRVDLWPDHDRPEVLVLITAELSEDATLPATIRLRLPPEAGDPSAVAHIDGDGRMFNAPFQTQSGDGATLLTVETTEPIVRVEYYFPYSRVDDTVQFTYTWLGGVAADELTILVQEPAQATQVSTGATFEDVGISGDGWRYHQWQVGAVEKDETRSATVTYNVPPPAPAESWTTSASNSSPIGYILTAICGVLIGTGIGWFLASRRRVRIRKAAHCSQCGHSCRPGDQFCRQCGARTG